MKNNVTFLIGNGFNYFARDFVADDKNKEAVLLNLSESLARRESKEVINNKSDRQKKHDCEADKQLFEQNYEYLLKSLDDYINLFNENYSIMDLGSEVDVQSFYEHVRGLNLGKVKTNNFLNEFEHILIKLKRNKVNEATIVKYPILPGSDQDSTKPQMRTFYLNSSLRVSFKYFDASHGKNSMTFAEHLEKVFTPYCGELKILTTNYDANIESVFVQISPSKNILSSRNMNVEYRAIHGNFYIGRNFVSKVKDDAIQKGKSVEDHLSTLYKIRDGKIMNHDIRLLDSGMVLTAPDLKMKRVMDFGRYPYIVDSIDQSDIIVMFGLGLTSDQYLLDLINLKKNINLIIITESEHKYRSMFLADTDDFLNRNFNTIYWIETGKDNLRSKHVARTPKELADCLALVMEEIKTRVM